MNKITFKPKRKMYNVDTFMGSRNKEHLELKKQIRQIAIANDTSMLQVMFAFLQVGLDEYNRQTGGGKRG